MVGCCWESFITYWAQVGYVMSQTESDADTTQRFTTNFSLTAASEGDRIAPELIPSSPEMEVGDRVSRHTARPEDREQPDERTFSVRLVVSRSDSYDDVQTALVYDPEADLFARLGGHTSSGAWNQKERDWKVRDIGSDVEVVDAWDISIPDLDDFDQAPEEFVAEWMDMLFGNAAFGDDISQQVESFDGNTLTLRDFDSRTAKVEYQLVSDE